MTGALIAAAFAFFDAAQTSKHIAESVLRLHVRANSDAIGDQKTKLLVRDAVLAKTEGLVESTDNRTVAEGKIKNNLNLFENAANTKLAELGASYTAKAVFEKTGFPTKVYGEVRLPAGEYDALVIELGEAKGQNWWCVMFPPLCYNGEYTENKEAVAVLKGNLNEEEFSVLTGGEQTVVKFKIVEMIGKILSIGN